MGSRLIIASVSSQHGTRPMKVEVEIEIEIAIEVNKNRNTNRNRNANRNKNKNENEKFSLGYPLGYPQLSNTHSPIVPTAHCIGTGRLCPKSGALASRLDGAGC